MRVLGSALDNAVIESWHSTLEFELRRLEHFATRAQARTRVAAWIEDYNTTRRHSACGMMPPVAWELAAGREPRESGRPLRGPGQEGGGFAAHPQQAAALQAGGRAAREYGAAPPASRLLRIACRRRPLRGRP